MRISLLQCHVPASRFCILGILLTAVVGCSSTSRTVTYDLAVPLNAANTRLAPSPGRRAIRFDVAGPAAATTTFGKGSCRLDSHDNRTLNMLVHDFGYDRDAYFRTLIAPEPVGTYAKAAASAALAARGIRVSDSAERKLTIQLDRFEFDGIKSEHIRRAILEGSVAVTDSQGNRLYGRRFAVEKSVNRANASAGIEIAGAALTSFVGVGFNGEGARQVEESKAALVVLRDAFVQFQDELISDQALLDALNGNEPVAQK